MCTGQVICIGEDSASVLSSSDSLMMLESSSSTLCSTNSLTHSVSSETPSSSDLSSMNVMRRNRRSHCNLSQGHSSAHATAADVLYEQFQNQFQNYSQPSNRNRFNSANNSNTTTTTQVGNSTIANNNHESSSTLKSYSSSSSFIRRDQQHHSHGGICYGEVYCYINTFILKLTRENDMNEGKRRHFATTLMIPIIAMNMNIFFDHFICFLTLCVIRYAANIWIDDDDNKMNDENNQVSHEHSSPSLLHHNDSSSTNNVAYDLANTASGAALSCCSSSLLTVTQHSLECDDSISKESSFNRPQHQENHDDDDPLSPATFIPTEPNEDGNDEWGHFTDFEVDVGQSLKDLSSTICSSSSTAATDSSRRGGTVDDPFCSITKSMLRRRGHKLSVCKLEQLQEDDEEEED